MSNKAYLANTQGQRLDQHLLAVAKRTVEVLKGLGLKSEIFNKLEEVAYLSGLYHDIGKVDSQFQEYITSKKAKKDSNYDDNLGSEDLRESKRWHQVYHQEISWAALKLCFNSMLSNPSERWEPSNILEYAVYWHHAPSAECRTNLNEIFDDCGGMETFTEITEFIKELNNRSTFKLSLKGSIYEPSSTPAPTPEYFTGVSHRAVLDQSYNTLITACLIEADREVSSWSNPVLDSYLDTVQEKSNVAPKVHILNTLEQSGERSLGQLSLAKELAQSNMSICAVDTGAGKTRVSLLWKSLIDSKRNEGRKLIIALPKVRQVDALFYSVKNDISLIVENSDTTTIQAVHGSKIQLPENCEQKLLDSNINIVVFDQMLKTFYKRSEIMNFMTIIKSDIVFDEFHEFLFVNRMLPSLSVIVMIRSWMVGQSTLFLSGTPNPGLVDFLFDKKGIKYLIKGRESLPEVHQNIADYEYAEGDNRLNSEDVETLQSFNRINDVQKSWIETDLSGPMVYSRMAPTDLKNKVQKILIEYGKHNKASNNVVSALMLQSSFDISFRNLKLQISQPDTIAQFLGRKDRHGDKPGGKVTLYSDPTPHYSFNDMKAGYKNIYNEYEIFIKETLQFKPKKWTHREATVQLYDNFWNAPGMKDLMSKEIEKRMKKSVDEMKKWYPKKSNKKAVVNKDIDLITNGSMFRGGGSLVAAVKCDYRLGLKFEDIKNKIMTTTEELVSVSPEKSIELFNILAYMCKTLVHAEAFKSAGFSTHEDLGKKWRYKKYNHGRQASKPLYYSHSNLSLSEAIENKLVDDNNNSDYSVYDSELGLINKDFFNKVVQKLQKREEV